MYQRLKTVMQVTSFLLFSAGILILLALIFGTTAQPQRTEPIPQKQGGISAAAGDSVLWPGSELFQSANGQLAISKTANKSTVADNEQVTFTVRITNTSSAPIAGILFVEKPAAEINIIGDPTFSVPVTPGTSPNSWTFNNPLPANETAIITIESQLVAAPKCDILTRNSASASAPGITAVEAQAVVKIVIKACAFLPVIRRDPTPSPTPIPIFFFDNFNDDDSGWPDNVETDNGRCRSEYRDNEYRIDIEGEGQDERDDCFRPAPKAAEFQYGLFEVEARRVGGDDEYRYGLYVNGKGGDEYYLFVIGAEDDCDWRLIRRDDGDSTTVREGGCDPAINRGGNKNLLSIRRSPDNTVSVYVNKKLLTTYTDSRPLNGEGTGLYALSGEGENRQTEIGFDNFIVKPYAAP